jgi:ubiquinone/menaquinone biosynthesis C-methylase UbiE
MPVAVNARSDAARGGHVARPLESDAWHAAYAQEAQRRRRRGAMPRKLGLLGIDAAPRQTAVLDLCCGHGEALETLYDMGFRNLRGVDLAVDEAVAASPRFRVTAGDATRVAAPDASFDWILNLHAMHHFATVENVQRFLGECWRLLRPGGRLSIVDFPNSPQIQMVFWWCRQNVALWTPNLKSLGQCVREEWHFLDGYLAQWPKVRSALIDGPFEVESRRRRLFYFYLTLRKAKPT